MDNPNSGHAKLARNTRILGMVNIVIWMLAIVAMIVVMERGSSVRGMFPILAGGVAVGTSLNAMIARLGRRG